MGYKLVSNRIFHRVAHNLAILKVNRIIKKSIERIVIVIFQISFEIISKF